MRYQEFLLDNQTGACKQEDLVAVGRCFECLANLQLSDEIEVSTRKGIDIKAIFLYHAQCFRKHKLNKD